MNDTSFDLIGIFREIFKKKVFVTGLALAAALVALVFCLVSQKEYTTQTTFIVKNPLLIDRNFVFRNTAYENKEFFAVPDDVDHIKTIAKSDAVAWFLIEKFKLEKAYGQEGDKLVKTVKGNFKAVMEDSKNIDLSYTDPDPARAQAIANAARDYLEDKFLEYFRATNSDLRQALTVRAAAITDTINRLDSTIVAIRQNNGLYNTLTPTRGNTIGAAGGGTNPTSAAAAEKLAEITTLKDRLSKDVADYKSLINEYEVMVAGKIKIFYIVQQAYLPSETSQPKTLLIVVGGFLAGLFFAAILVLFRAFYRQTIRP
ncbi:MAG: Wzz/FepE/Etk N-terminal domain-containing protein [Edaphocola sp.]